MEEKTLALLVATFPGARKDGLKQLARILSLQVTTEDEAKALVSKLTKEKVDEFVKEFRAEVDKEVSDSNKTFENNLKKKFDLVEKKQPETETKPKEGDNKDVEAIMKQIAEMIKPLQADIAGIKAGDVTKTRLQSLTEKLNVCKDETLKTKALKDFNRMTFETDDAFNEYLADTEKDIATANQNAANQSLGGNGKPLLPNVPADGKPATKEEMAAVMDKILI
jgi:hypothetical protein